MTTKHDIAQQIVDLQTILEIAKDNLLEARKEDGLKLLQQACFELKRIIWRATPTKQHEKNELR